MKTDHPFSLINRLVCLVLVAASASFSARAADAPPVAAVKKVVGLPGYVTIGLGRGNYNRLCLVATVEGRKGLMMLDTGATDILLNRDKYPFLLPSGDRKLPKGVPPAVPVNDTMSPTGVTRDFHIANLDLGAVPVALVEHRLLYDAAMLYVGKSDRQYDGLVGENVLRHYNAVLDCGRCGLYLNTDPARKHDFGPAFVRAGWTRIPMSDLSTDFTVPCRINGHTFRIIVDTGAPFTTLDKNLVGSTQLNVVDIPMSGGVIGGHDRQAGYVRLADWQLGDYAAPPTHSIVAEGLRGYFGGNNAGGGDRPVVGLLGSDFLATNNAVVDIGSHTLYLKTGAGH